MLEKYAREFWAWRALNHVVECRAISDAPKRMPLSLMTEHLIRDYILHGDHLSALDILQSAQYGLHTPSTYEILAMILIFSELLRSLVMECYLQSKEYQTTHMLLEYILRIIENGSMDGIIDELVRNNFMEDSQNFWDILRSLIESTEINPKRRVGILSIIEAIIRRKLINQTLKDFVILGLDDRRLRRRFISTHLLGLFSLLIDHDNCTLNILSMILISLTTSREYWEAFMNEVYDYACQFDDISLFTFLQV